jgi:hypothetical protein
MPVHEKDTDEIPKNDTENAAAVNSCDCSFASTAHSDSGTKML